MALKNGRAAVPPSPPFQERILQALKRYTVTGDHKKVYSLLLCFIVYKVEELPFCNSNISDLFDELCEGVELVESDLESYQAFFERMVEMKEDRIFSTLMSLNKEILSTIQECKKWLEDISTAEWMEHKLLSLYPCYLFVALMRITQCGIEAVNSGKWDLHPNHQWLLTSINEQKDISFSQITDMY